MEFSVGVNPMKKRKSHRRLSLMYLLLLIITCFLCLSGCSSTVDPSYTKTNKELDALLNKKPVEMLTALSSIFREKPNLKILGTVDPEIFEQNPTLTVVDQNGKVSTEKVQGINLKINYVGNISYEQESLVKEFRKKLIMQNAKSIADFDLLLTDDFLPLTPGELNLLESNLDKAVWLLKSRKSTTKSPGRDQKLDFARFSPKRSEWRSPVSTENNEFLNSTFFYRPLGLKGPSKMIPISVNRMVILYNQVAWSAYHHLRSLEKLDEGGNPKNAEIPAIEELHFFDFIKYLKRWNMRMLYPNPKSADPNVAKLGLAFICQLISWIDNSSYQTFLQQPESPKIMSSMRKVNEFIRQNRDVLISSDNLQSMFDQSLNENILENPPSNFTFPNFYDLKKVPDNYKLDEVDYRMTFAYLPETYYIEAISNFNWKIKNKEVLAEIEKQEAEERKREEAKRQRRRRGKERKRKKNLTKSNSEIVEKQTEKDIEESVKKIVIERNNAMIASFNLKDHIALREYCAIPINTLNKKEALSFAVSLLQENGQEAIALNYLQKTGKKSVKFFKARRPIRLDKTPYVWITKEYPPKNKKKNSREKPPREVFKTSIYLSQIDSQRTFLPVLNYYYLRAIDSLWKKRNI